MYSIGSNGKRVNGFNLAEGKFNLDFHMGRHVDACFFRAERDGDEWTSHRTWHANEVWSESHKADETTKSAGNAPPFCVCVCVCLLFFFFLGLSCYAALLMRLTRAGAVVLAKGVLPGHLITVIMTVIKGCPCQVCLFFIPSASFFLSYSFLLRIVRRQPFLMQPLLNGVTAPSKYKRWRSSENPVKKIELNENM